MAVSTDNVKPLFAFAWMARRQNPDGKPATAQNTLGFVGTIDITSVLTSGRANLLIKVGTSTVQKKSVDFSDATPAALTPAAAVIALSAAGFTGVQFSVDSETGRLKAATTDTSEQWLQIYSELAGALDFGNCRKAGGKGCYLYPSFDDDMKSAIPTTNRTDETVIENDGAFGRKTKLVIPGSRDTVTLQILDKVSSNEFKQMVEGGTLTLPTANTPEKYSPPKSSDNAERRLDVWVFTYLFTQDQNTKGSYSFVQQDLYLGAVGAVSKVITAGAWTDTQYDFTCAEQTDYDGEIRPVPEEIKFDRSQWDALNLVSVIERDWIKYLSAN